MANRREVKRNMKRLERVKTWQLVILLVLSLFVSATFLRLNNTGMVERREAVFAADKRGDEQQIQDRLYDLQRYASSHMNANPGDIYLDKEYNRDVQDIIDAERSDSSERSKAFKQADTRCKAQFSVYSQAYIVCNAAEQKKIQDSLPASQASSDLVQFPDPLLYRHAFISPVWSTDFAGLSVLISVLLLLVILVRSGFAIVLRILLKYEYRRA